MNCPICHQPLIPKADPPLTEPFLICDNAQRDPEHRFSVYLENNQISIFSLGVENWFITCNESGWTIVVYKENDGKTIIVNYPKMISPEEAYQILLKYMNLKTFL
jgi:hypothetical protein